MPSDTTKKSSASESCQPKTICGWITFVAASIPVCAAGLVGGVVSVANGESFGKGFEETCEGIGEVLIDPVIQFADKHSDTVVKGALSGAAVALGKKTFDSSKK